MRDHSEYRNKQSAGANPNADGQILRGRVPSVAIHLCHFGVADRRGRVRFPIAQDEVVVADLGNVALNFRSVLQVDGRLRSCSRLLRYQLLPNKATQKQ